MQDRRRKRVYVEREHQRGDRITLASPHTRILSPVALRPVVRVARRRTIVDRLLLLGEWLAALALVGFAGYQVYEGPVQDWLHEPQAAQAAAQVVVAQPVVPAPTPTEALPATEAQPEPAATRMLHPELGYALPSINEKWRRPAVSPDYLQPARDFVPAAVVPPPAVVQASVAQASLPAMNLPPTRVHAPIVGIDTMTQEVFLVDGTWQVADYAAGYLNGTGVPGSGNVVMAGHQGIRGAVFATLEALKPGNEVYVDTATQRFRYRVRETGNVWPSQVSVMFPTATPTLTLMTCTNWDMQRFVVIADLVDTAALQESATTS